MVRRVVAGLLAIWGLLIVGNAALSGFATSGTSTYAAGEVAGWIFGGILLVAGGYYAFKK